MPYVYRTFCLGALLALGPVSDAFARQAPVTRTGQDGSAPSPTAPWADLELSVTGTERLAWEQPATSASELRRFGFVAYLDGELLPMTVVCQTDSPGEFGFPCEAPLPPLTIGSHSLEIAAFSLGDDRVEGERSSTLRLRVAPPASTPESARQPWIGPGVHLSSLETPVDDPTDLAALPDGSVLLAARAGDLYLVSENAQNTTHVQRLDDVVAGNGRGLLSVAVDPAFAKSRAVFLLYTTADGARVARYTLAADGRLVDRAIVLEALPIKAAQPSAVLRLGHDGTLYVALDGGDLSRADVPQGAVLHVNADGTTAGGQSPGMPVIVDSLGSPLHLTVAASAPRVWAASSDLQGAPILQAVDPGLAPARRARVSRVALPAALSAAALTAIATLPAQQETTALLIATRDDRGLIYVTGSAADQATWWLRGLTAPLSALVVTPSGLVYGAMPYRLLRIEPPGR